MKEASTAVPARTRKACFVQRADSPEYRAKRITDLKDARRYAWLTIKACREQLKALR